MEFSARQIAEILGGEIVGNADETVGGLSKIEEGKKGTLSFLGNPKYEEFIYSTEASIVIVNDDFDAAYQEIRAVLHAERLKRERREGLLDFVGGLLAGL